MHPKNEEHFKRLITFTKKIIKLCNENNIHAVVYGSFAHFYHTKQNIDVNDIDLMIQKEDYPKLINLLEKLKIEFKYKPKYEEIFIREANLLIEVDVVDSKYNELLPDSDSKGYIKIDFYGEPLKIIDIKTVEKIYVIANQGNNSDWEKILMKTKEFEKFLGRKIL